MIDLPVNYAKVLFDMNVAEADVAESRELMESFELMEALNSPIISKSEKRKVIEQLFPASVWNFFKVMSDNGDIACAADMFDAYDALIRERESTIEATFTYVTKPEDAQIEQLKQKIASKYGKSIVNLKLVEDSSLIGGFVLEVGESVLDQSVRTSMTKLKRHFAVR